jgi:hypothetical protein
MLKNKKTCAKHNNNFILYWLIQRRFLESAGTTIRLNVIYKQFIEYNYE